MAGCRNVFAPSNGCSRLGPVTGLTTLQIKITGWSKYKELRSLLYVCLTWNPLNLQKKTPSRTQQQQRPGLHDVTIDPQQLHQLLVLKADVTTIDGVGDSDQIYRL